jgi:hypothetical protein
VTLISSSKFIFFWFLNNFRRMALGVGRSLTIHPHPSAGFNSEEEANDGQTDDGQIDEIDEDESEGMVVCFKTSPNADGIDFVPYNLFHHDSMESAFNDPEWMAMAWSLSARTACIAPERIRA